MPSLVDAATRTSERPLVRPCDLAVLDAVDVESVGLFCFSDVRPLAGVAGFVDWRSLGALSRCMMSGLFRGEWGETLLVPRLMRGGPRRVFLFGLGPLGMCDETRLEEACAHGAQVMRRAGVSGITFAAPCAPTALDLEMQFVHALHSLAVSDVAEVWIESPTSKSL